MWKKMKFLAVISCFVMMLTCSACTYEEFMEGFVEIEDALSFEFEKRVDAYFDEKRDEFVEAFGAFVDSIPEKIEEICAPVTDPLVEYSQRIFNPFQWIIKRDWEPVFTSCYDNEIVQIYQRHAKRWGFHCTLYFVTVQNGDTYTYYCPTMYGPSGCNSKAIPCDSGYIPLKSVCGEKEWYPYVENITAYQILKELDVNGGEITALANMLGSNFKEVVKSQGDAILSETFCGAVDIILDGKELIAKLNEVNSNWEEASNISNNTSSKDDLGAGEFIPGISEMVEGLGVAQSIVAVRGDKVNTFLQQGFCGEGLVWYEIASLDQLSPDGRGVEFQLSESHLQWRCEGEEHWNDLEAFEDLATKQFMVTETHVYWRELSNVEREIMEQQRLLHETVKRVGYEVR